MAHGLDEHHELVIRWGWMPQPAWALDRALPSANWRDDDAFFAIMPPAEDAVAYGGSFPQLSQLTPDLRFYRLVRVFNTPLRSLHTREAGRAGHAYWGGAHPELDGEGRWAHLWFFKDQNDGDNVVIEYSFAGRLILRAEKKSPAALETFYSAICQRLAISTPTHAHIPLGR